MAWSMMLQTFSGTMALTKLIDTRFFIAEGVHRLGGLQYHQATGVDLNACSRHQFNVLTQSDDWLPERMACE